jgi:hypothetical protein
MSSEPPLKPATGTATAPSRGQHATPVRRIPPGLNDTEVVARLHHIAHHDQEHSHPPDLSDAGLLAELEGREPDKVVAKLVLEAGKPHHHQ